MDVLDGIHEPRVSVPPGQRGQYSSQLRLLLEELCCDLCRFDHIQRDNLAAEVIHIDREYDLGVPGCFADLRVAPGDLGSYFLEVKFGYANEELLRLVRRKYGQESAALRGVAKVIVVIDAEGRANWSAVEAKLRQFIWSGLELEIWDEKRLRGLVADSFDVKVPAFSPETLLDLRQSVERYKGFHAFGGASLAEYQHDPLKSVLMWHFGFWNLRQFTQSGQQSPRDVFKPGLYRNVAVLLGDMCSFSSYVRDTPDKEIIRENLTSFYSKARYQIINNHGMFYQFVGDEVIGLFGIPEHQAGTARSALNTARALASIGTSVANSWQRRIDRVQPSSGLHLGMAIGDLEIVSLRPYSRTHMGAIGDCINVAARLMSVSGADEIVVTNSFFEQLEEEDQAGFEAVDPVDAKNVGRIKAWKLNLEKMPRNGSP